MLLPLLSPSPIPKRISFRKETGDESPSTSKSTDDYHDNDDDHDINSSSWSNLECDNDNDSWCNPPELGINHGDRVQLQRSASAPPQAPSQSLVCPSSADQPPSPTSTSTSNENDNDNDSWCNPADLGASDGNKVKLQEASSSAPPPLAQNNNKSGNMNNSRGTSGGGLGGNHNNTGMEIVYNEENVTQPTIIPASPGILANEISKSKSKSKSKRKEKSEPNSIKKKERMEQGVTVMSPMKRLSSVMRGGTRQNKNKNKNNNKTGNVNNSKRISGGGLEGNHNNNGMEIVSNEANVPQPALIPASPGIIANEISKSKSKSKSKRKNKSDPNSIKNKERMEPSVTAMMSPMKRLSSALRGGTKQNYKNNKSGNGASVWNSTGTTSIDYGPGHETNEAFDIPFSDFSS